MNSIFGSLAASLAISASLLVGCMATPDTSATTGEQATGEATSAVRFSPFYPLINVRSGPGFQYQIIYQILEDIQAAMVGMLKPEFEEVVTGDAEVR